MSGGGGGGGGKPRRGHEEEHEEHENHERWLVSYADMMTLLMVLFIVMFAISQVDHKKFMALKVGLAAGFGAPVEMMAGADGLLDVGGEISSESMNLTGASGNAAGAAGQDAEPGMVSPEKVAELAKAMEKATVEKEVKDLKETQAELEKALQVAGLAKGATFRFDERGLVISIATDDVLFDSGQATLKLEGRRILNALVPTLASVDNRISVDGHTNNIPISTARFPSNWELSTDRATGVLRYLATKKVPVKRMSATGFADTHPLLPASNSRSVVVNRRVEIVLLANVDNPSGRAVSELGNTVPATPTPTPSAPAPAAAPAATPEATPAATPKASAPAHGSG